MKLFFLLILFLIPTHQVVWSQQKADKGAMQRNYFIQSLTRIADPVLIALSKSELKKQMPVEAKAGARDRNKYTYLEAFGRTLSGIAPWLELGAEDSREGRLRKKYIELARVCIDKATHPQSPDVMNFNQGSQPLVDAAFFAQALLRAPVQLWYPLSDSTKNNVIASLKSTRSIQPFNNNWLLFTAMVETALLKFTGDCDTAKINHALSQHQHWYKGDGTYGDGANLHWDYYNSFVIQPMLIEIVQELNNNGFSKKELYKTVMQRAIRYAAIQERLISPEGTYPPMGRSLAYRFGAFQLLSKIAAMQALPEEIQPQQVRAALYNVLKKQIEATNTFDANGWLTIGFYGHQPGLGEAYISTGSLYLCTEIFLILGLPPTNSFWKGEDMDWTSKKIWKGMDVPIDHALD